jgi:hypothetical protein
MVNASRLKISANKLIAHPPRIAPSMITGFIYIDWCDIDDENRDVHPVQLIILMIKRIFFIFSLMIS